MRCSVNLLRETYIICSKEHGVCAEEKSDCLKKKRYIYFILINVRIKYENTNNIL